MRDVRVFDFEFFDAQHVNTTITMKKKKVLSLTHQIDMASTAISGFFNHPTIRISTVVYHSSKLSLMFHSCNLFMKYYCYYFKGFIENFRKKLIHTIA